MKGISLLKISVEDKDECFIVNGVTLEKSKVVAVFPGNKPDKALAKYLALVPFLHEKAEHFRKHHKLSEAAAWGIDRSHDLIKAIDLPEEAYIPFMLACMAQAETEPDEMSDEARNTFGKCDDPHHEEDEAAAPTLH